MAHFPQTISLLRITNYPLQRLTSTKATAEDEALVTRVLQSISHLQVSEGKVCRKDPLPPKPADFDATQQQQGSKAKGRGAVENGATGEFLETSSQAVRLTAPRHIHAFRKVPETGVIYVTNRATEMGFRPGSSEWANLGQGSPETTVLENWPKSVRRSIAGLEAQGLVNTDVMHTDGIEVTEENSHYGPVNGDWELRCAVAKYYNEMFRKGKHSQYTAENVAIVGGGRLALTRVCSAVGQINLGHFLPDYTAYEELLGVGGEQSYQHGYLSNIGFYSCFATYHLFLSRSTQTTTSNAR